MNKFIAILLASIASMVSAQDNVFVNPPDYQVVVFSSGSASNPFYIKSVSTIPVSVSGSVSVTGSTITVNLVSGSSMSVTFPSAQPVSGTFFQATQPVSTVSTFPVSGTFWQATQPVSTVSTFPVSGTFWQATQPVSGGVTVNGSTLAITNVLGSTITVVLTNSAVTITGTPTVSIGASTMAVTNVNGQNLNVAVNAALPAGTANIGTVNGSTLTVVGVAGAAIPVSLASLPSGAVTNAGTFLVQVNAVSNSTIAVTNANGQNFNVAVAAALPTGTNNIGTINGSTIAITGIAGSTITAVLTNSAVTITGTPTVTVNGSTVAVTGIVGSTLTVVLTNSSVTNLAGTANIGTINGSTVAVTGIAGSTLTVVLTNSAVTVSGVPAVTANGSTVAVTGISGSSLTVVLTNSTVGLLAGTLNVGTVNGSTVAITGISGSSITAVLTNSAVTVTTGSISAFQGGSWTDTIVPQAGNPILVAASSNVAFGFVSTGTLASNATMFCLINRDASKVVRILDLNAFVSSTFTLTGTSVTFNVVMTTAPTSLTVSGVGVSSFSVDSAYIGSMSSNIFIASSTYGFAYQSGQSPSKGFYRAFMSFSVSGSQQQSPTLMWPQDPLKPQITLRQNSGLCVFSSVNSQVSGTPEITFTGMFTQQ